MSSSALMARLWSGRLRGATLQPIEACVDQWLHLRGLQRGQLLQGSSFPNVRDDQVADVIAHARREARQMLVAVEQGRVILFLLGIEQRLNRAESRRAVRVYRRTDGCRHVEQ